MKTTSIIKWVAQAEDFWSTARTQLDNVKRDQDFQMEKALEEQYESMLISKPSSDIEHYIGNEYFIG